MRSREELFSIMDLICADVEAQAAGADQVPEHLIVVADSTVAARHSAGYGLYLDGDVIAFVNDTGVPFVEQSQELIRRASALNPEAVMLAGTALTGRPGEPFRKVLAVQLFSAEHALRTARIADLEILDERIVSVGPWKEAKAGPPVWAEEILGASGR